MTNEERLLLICADPNLESRGWLLDEASELVRRGVDWRSFFKRAAYNSIFPQAYENAGIVLDAHGMDTYAQGYYDWKPMYFQTMARNMKFRREALRAMEALAREGIPFSPVKGLLLKGLYYPEHITRDFDDVDLLLPGRGPRQRAREVLESQGFRRIHSGTDSYHVKMAKPAHGIRVLIELHQRLGATTYYSYPRIEGLWSSLVAAKLEGTEVRAVGPEHAFLITALNALRDSVFKLKDLADLLSLTCGRRGFDWRVIRPYSGKVGWSHIIALPLKALHAYRSVMGPAPSLETEGPLLSYPIPYEDACTLLHCRRNPEGLIFSLGEGRMDLTMQTSSQAFSSFMKILSLQGRLIVTHVRPDYGMSGALGCAGEMFSHALRMALHEVRQRLPHAPPLQPLDDR